MDAESQLRRLRKNVEEQSQEIARLTSELGQQSRLVKLLDENLQQTSQQTFALEYRLSNLEHERETNQRSTRMAFESLGARVTELGIEVAELPTAKEMKDTWRQLEQSVTSLEHQLRQDMDGRLEALNVELKGLGGRHEDVHSGLRKDAGEIRQDLDGCRQDIASLLRHLWGDELPARAVCLDERLDKPQVPACQQMQEQMEPRTLQTPTEPTTLQCQNQYRAAPAGTAGVPLVPRLKQAEDRLSAMDGSRKADYENLLQRLELKADSEEMTKCLATKSDISHTHDRLISADGSATFAL
ncbi:unnamed protein product [Symbiodinium pilosum]|uniref:Uncharacterized protein n=1 Tax=Symbiodinium pilosum TaxID=2952 RepID=A0A812YK13_SYMPI|nr:unnamed protein product [Symbiodinium pilosum]